MVELPVEETFGGRVRALRAERGLSQEALAGLCGHGNSWLSRIEGDITEPSLADLRALADGLKVAVGWLVTGEASGDTEFIARLKGLEKQLDRRGRNAVLAVAQQQVDDAE